MLSLSVVCGNKVRLFSLRMSFLLLHNLFQNLGNFYPPAIRTICYLFPAKLLSTSLYCFTVR